jgi:predicted dehydrogenase
MNINRRNFIAGSAAGAFFVAASGRALGAGAASNRLRFALVGCHEKGRGVQVGKAALKNAGVEIACVCDVDSRARDFAAGLFGKMQGIAVRKEKDFRKVLEMKDIDGIISETPDHFHAYSAVMAMRAGKHVWVEKPCAFCPAEVFAMRRAQAETGMVFQQGSQRRSAPSFIAAIREIREKDLIGEPHWGRCWYNTVRGPIGRGKEVAVPEWLDWDLWQGPAPREAFRDNVVHYNWHWFRTWGTGECGNNQVHFVDVARWMLGCEWPERVVSGGGKYWMPADQDWQWPDTQMVSYEFPNGKFISWEGTCCTDVKPHMGVGTGAVVYGDKGAVYFAPGGGVTVFDNKSKPVKEWEPAGVPKDKIITNTNNRSGGGWFDSTPVHFGNFADCIRANAPQKCAANVDIATKSTFLALVGNVAQLTGEVLKINPSDGSLLSGGAAAKIWSREYQRGWEVA